MLLKRHVGSRDRAVGTNALLKFVLCSMSFALVSVSMLAWSLRTHTRTILVPPVVRAPMTFEDGKTDDATLRDYVFFISSLAFSYTPATARQQFTDLLRWYVPERFAAATSAWMNHAADIEAARVTTVFALNPGSIDINPRQKTISLTGTRGQYQETAPIGSPTPISYQVKYDIRAGRFLLLDIAEMRR